MNSQSKINLQFAKVTTTKKRFLSKKSQTKARSQMFATQLHMATKSGIRFCKTYSVEAYNDW